MRARLALAVSDQQTVLREVVLRDKPQAFLDVSPSATVPCLVTPTHVLDESLDIMIWALKRNDPENWLGMPQVGNDWITRCDGPFKEALDRTKYATRYADADPDCERAKAAVFLTDLDQQITDWMFDHPTLADFALLPFVRQFAFIDRVWFDAQPWPDLQRWLDRFLASSSFAQIMVKYPQWHQGDALTTFP
jgi:glutathione S-transferase